MSTTKLRTRFVSGETKETISRLMIGNQIQELEFQQKTNLVTESLLKAKCMYIMNVIFAIKTKDGKFTDQNLRESQEILDFLELLTKNHLTSQCIFIPFRSINAFLDKYPLTTFFFAKHRLEYRRDIQTNEYESNNKVEESYLDDPLKPICYHVIYRQNSSNKDDTFKTVEQALGRVYDLTNEGYRSTSLTRILCYFDQDEATKQFDIRIRTLPHF
jgi:hypothetical protein